MNTKRRRRHGVNFNVIVEKQIHKDDAVDYTNTADSSSCVTNDDDSIEMIHSQILQKYFPISDEESKLRRGKFETESHDFVRILREYEEKEMVTSIGQKIKRNNNRYFYLSSYYNLLNTKYNIIIPHINAYRAVIICDECGSEMRRDNECEYDDSICSECYNKHEILQNKPSYSDKNNITSSRSVYVEQELTKAIHYIQGKIGNDVIPIEVFGRFSDYCEKNNIDMQTVRPQQAKTIFRDIDYRQYDHIYAFLNIINDYPLITISPEYEYLIRMDNFMYMQEYEKIKGARSSSPNSYFKLMLFLKRYDFDIPYEDLKIPTLPKTLNELSDISKEIFDRLGWEYIGI